MTILYVEMGEKRNCVDETGAKRIGLTVVSVKLGRYELGQRVLCVITGARTYCLHGFLFQNRSIRTCLIVLYVETGTICNELRTLYVETCAKCIGFTVLCVKSGRYVLA